MGFGVRGLGQLEMKSETLKILNATLLRDSGRLCGNGIGFWKPPPNIKTENGIRV